MIIEEKGKNIIEMYHWKPFLYLNGLNSKLVDAEWFENEWENEKYQLKVEFSNTFELFYDFYFEHISWMTNGE